MFAVLAASNSWAFTITGFKTPESIIKDEKTGFYYISNINGGPLETNDNGFISKADFRGNIINKYFVRGNVGNIELNAPKGMGIYKRVLYVADIDEVRGFSLEDGSLKATIYLGSTFANDIVIDDEGFMYISDMMENRIYRVNIENNYSFEIYSSGRMLASPNGLAIHPKTGRVTVLSFDTGDINELSPTGSVRLLLKTRLKRLDGAAYDAEGNLYVSSFSMGEIYKISPEYIIEVIATKIITPADISYDSKLKHVLVASFFGNYVISIPSDPKEKK